MRSRSDKRKKHGKFPYFSILIGATLSLFVFGYLCSLSLSYYRLQGALRSHLKLNVYLEPNLSENQVKNTLQSLRFKKFISTSDDIVLTRAEDFAREFVTNTGENYTDVLSEIDSPFRDVVSIVIKATHSKSDYLPSIKSEIEKVEGVYEVDLPTHFKSSIKSLNKTFNLLNVIIFSIALLSLTIVFVIITGSIKLSMFSQRFLIRSMQLVGANKWFIVRPFVVRAFLNGLFSGMLASGFVYLVYNYGNKVVLKAVDVRVPDEIFNFDDMKIILIALPLIGSILMALFTSRIVSKYLRFSLDDLY